MCAWNIDFPLRGLAPPQAYGTLVDGKNALHCVVSMLLDCLRSYCLQRAHEDNLVSDSQTDLYG